MLNLEKVKLMTKLSMYETTKGQEYLPVSRYYRSDYIGLALIKNLFLVTAGYLLLVGAVVLCRAEYLLQNIHKMNLMNAGVVLLLGYAVFLAVYSVLTYLQYAVRYHRAKTSVKDYYVNLSRLAQIYERDAKRSAARGGNRREQE